MGIDGLFKGKRESDLPRLPASSRPYTLEGVTVVIREEDKIVREAIYYDVAHLISPA